MSKRVVGVVVCRSGAEPEVVAASVEVADTFVRRFVGLMGRRRLGKEEGLWMRPGGAVHTGFMRVPIDVLFLDRSRRILKVSAAIAPWRLVLAPAQTREVLELPAGTTERRGICEGLAVREVEACDNPS